MPLFEHNVSRFRIDGVAALTLAIVIIASSCAVTWARVTDNLVPTSGGPGAPSFQGCRKGSIGDQHFPCQTDNRNVYYFMRGSLEGRDKKVVYDVIRQQYSPTDLVRHYDSTPKYHGSGETDIVYQEGKVPGGDEGFTWCNDPDGTYSCDQQYVRIQGGGDYTPGLTCHETGHAVGLVHGRMARPRVGNQRRALRCMRKSVTPLDILGRNNRQNINRTY